MAIIRAQVSSQGATLQPEDRYVNVFYFTGDPLTADLGTLATTIGNFYTVTPSGSANPLNYWMSGISGYPGSTIKLYNMADPKPRAPILTRDWDASGHAGSSSKNLPDEVALCLSYHAAGASGIPIARRRGRVYIGPFSDNALRTGEGVSSESAPAVALMECIVDAATQLRSVADGANWTWSVFSPTNEGAAEIVGWHVDNAWDTQRRRGNRPTSRITGGV